MAAYTWNAFNGGDWNNARDWTPHGIPSSADTVDFNTGGVFYTVTGDGFTAALTVTADGVTFSVLDAAARLPVRAVSANAFNARKEGRDMRIPHAWGLSSH